MIAINGGFRGIFPKPAAERRAGFGTITVQEKRGRHNWPFPQRTPREPNDEDHREGGHRAVTPDHRGPPGKAAIHIAVHMRCFGFGHRIAARDDSSIEIMRPRRLALHFVPRIDTKSAAGRKRGPRSVREGAKPFDVVGLKGFENLQPPPRPEMAP